MGLAEKTVLLVEDDEVDILTVKRAMSKLNISNPLHVEKNGEKALAYLENNLDSLPGIIILDIHMPRMNGLEFLSKIKNDERFLKIPAVVLTTSKEQQDRLESYNKMVAGYIQKPVEFNDFVNVVDIIYQYWTANEFPD